MAATVEKNTTGKIIQSLIGSPRVKIEHVVNDLLILKITEDFK